MARPKLDIFMIVSFDVALIYYVLQGLYCSLAIQKMFFLNKAESLKCMIWNLREKYNSISYRSNKNMCDKYSWVAVLEDYMFTLHFFMIYMTEELEWECLKGSKNKWKINLFLLIYLSVCVIAKDSSVTMDWKKIVCKWQNRSQIFKEENGLF